MLVIALSSLWVWMRLRFRSPVSPDTKLVKTYSLAFMFANYLIRHADHEELPELNNLSIKLYFISLSLAADKTK